MTDTNSTPTSEAQHTPEPWSVVVADDGETYICGGEPVEGNLPRPIAVMMRDDDEAHANAHLIKAAPDMLDVLESVLPEQADHAPTGIEGWLQCSHLEDGHEDGDCPQDLDDDSIVGIVLADVLAAIAKAKGEQQ